MMCFCDGCYYLVTNKSTGEKHLINGDEPLYKFFKGLYSLPLLFHRLMKKEFVQLDSTHYVILHNTHPECQRVKMELSKMHGVKEFELWGRCPDKYRHLLPSERQ